MLAPERHTFILEELVRRGVVRIANVAAELSVSEMTIRRDLEQLSDQGMLNKVHGGATVKVDTAQVTEPPFRTKSMREQGAKDAIAEAAAAMITPAAAVALMGGSTVFALAKRLVSVPRLTVVTIPARGPLRPDRYFGRRVAHPNRFARGRDCGIRL
jgi:DeoR/GlpR family transcriptional regulator of sugar metabolism